MSKIVDAFPLLFVNALDVRIISLTTCLGRCFRLEYFCNNGHIYTELGKTQQIFSVCFPKTTHFHSSHWARWLSSKAWAPEHGYNVRSSSPYVVTFGRLSNFMAQMKLKSFEDCQADANLPLLFLLFQLGWFGRVQYEARLLTNNTIALPQMTSTKAAVAGFSQVNISGLQIFTIALHSCSGSDFLLSYFMHNGHIFTQLDITQQIFLNCFPTKRDFDPTCNYNRWLKSSVWKTDHGFNVTVGTTTCIVFGRLSNFLTNMKLKSIDDCRNDKNFSIFFLLFQLGWFGHARFEIFPLVEHTSAAPSKRKLGAPSPLLSSASASLLLSSSHGGCDVEVGEDVVDKEEGGRNELGVSGTEEGGGGGRREREEEEEEEEEEEGGGGEEEENAKEEGQGGLYDLGDADGIDNGVKVLLGVKDDDDGEEEVEKKRQRRDGQHEKFHDSPAVDKAKLISFDGPLSSVVFEEEFVTPLAKMEQPSDTTVSPGLDPSSLQSKDVASTVLLYDGQSRMSAEEWKVCQGDDDDWEKLFPDVVWKGDKSDENTGGDDESTGGGGESIDSDNESTDDIDSNSSSSPSQDKPFDCKGGRKTRKGTVYIAQCTPSFVAKLPTTVNSSSIPKQRKDSIDQSAACGMTKDPTAQPAACGMTIGDAVGIARVNLQVSAHPKAIIADVRKPMFEMIAKRLLCAMHGKCLTIPTQGKSMGGGGAGKLSTRESFAGGGTSMFICGSPGVGKSAVVKCVVDCLRGHSCFEAEQSDVASALAAVASNCPPVVIDLHGRRWPSGIDEYRRIGFEMGVFNPEKDLLSKAREMVFQQFRKPAGQIKGGKKIIRLTILVIDEIDSAPEREIEELLSISGEGCGGDGLDPSRALNDSECVNTSSLIVIGIANKLNFPNTLRKLHVTSRPKIIVFEPYDDAALTKILNMRSCGLFELLGAKMIARKVAGKSGFSLQFLCVLLFQTHVSS